MIESRGRDDEKLSHTMKYYITSTQVGQQGLNLEEPVGLQIVSSAVSTR